MDIDIDNNFISTSSLDAIDMFLDKMLEDSIHPESVHQGTQIRDHSGAENLIAIPKGQIQDTSIELETKAAIDLRDYILDVGIAKRYIPAVAISSFYAIHPTYKNLIKKSSSQGLKEFCLKHGKYLNFVVYKNGNKSVYAVNIVRSGGSLSNDINSAESSVLGGKKRGGGNDRDRDRQNEYVRGSNIDSNYMSSDGAEGTLLKNGLKKPMKRFKHDADGDRDEYPEQNQNGIDCRDGDNIDTRSSWLKKIWICSAHGCNFENFSWRIDCKMCRTSRARDEENAVFTVELSVPNASVATVIGQGGLTIREIVRRSCTLIHIRSSEPNMDFQIADITGTAEQNNVAKELIKKVIKNGHRGMEDGYKDLCMFHLRHWLGITTIDCHHGFRCFYDHDFSSMSASELKEKIENMHCAYENKKEVRKDWE